MKVQTQMKEAFDGTVHPPLAHSSREAAIAYAKQRTAEKQCDITVSDPNGSSVVFRLGAEVKE